MISEIPRRQLARERFATFGIFVSFGLVLGTWAAHLPALKQTIGASSSSMGAILLVLGVGAFVGMQVSGHVVDRFGSGRVAVSGGAAISVTLVPPLVLSTWLTVAIAALSLGLSIGVTEVGMNAVAVEVERHYRRPIMASFHGMFSIGTVVGALLGAAAFASGIDGLTSALITVTCALGICIAAAPTLMQRPSSGHGVHVDAQRTSDVTMPAPQKIRRLAVLGALAFLLLLTEGSAMDWSGLHAQQHLGGGPSSGALALASFVSAMTVGRFVVDQVAARVGPVKVLRWGSVIAAVGTVVVTQAPSLPAGCVGWLLVGLGLSGCVPQVFTAAGDVAGASGKSLSRVVGAGYLAVLAGPAIVGWLADMFTLNRALYLPLAALIVCAGAAGAVATSPRSTR